MRGDEFCKMGIRHRLTRPRCHTFDGIPERWNSFRILKQGECEAWYIDDDAIRKISNKRTVNFVLILHDQEWIIIQVAEVLDTRPCRWSE